MVLCCCSGIDLHFLHQSTFLSRRQNTSPSWAVWRLRGPMVFILAYYCLYRWTCETFRHLEIAPKDEPDLWRSTNFFWGLGWFILIVPWCQAKRHWVWRWALKYIHRYTSNWLKLCQLAYQKLLKPWHTFLEFSKLFKGTVNLVYVNFWPTGIVIQWIIGEIICL